VEDHCEAIWLVIREGKAGKTYTVGGDNQPTNLQVISTLCGILDEALPSSRYKPHESLIQFVADRPGHDRRYAMDISKIQRELGWRPRRSLEEGLLLTVEWYLSHQDWVHVIRSRGDYRTWMEKNYAHRGGNS
jgi:dTDP-glucose 4,6-dehydratase